MAYKYKRIFVVDDDEVTNFVTQKLIHQFDEKCEITTFTNPENALDRILDSQKNSIELPEVILLDINMPGISGFEFLERMKEEGLASQIHVIMYSSSNNIDDKKRSSLFTNVIGYLEKPFSAQAYGRILDKTPY